MIYYACYERIDNKWELVVYHGEKPVDTPTSPLRSRLYLIPAHQIDHDGTPLFGAIAKSFKAPTLFDED